MTIEPHAARFQIGRPILPPKFNRPLPKPAMTMEEDAARIKDRYRKTFKDVTSACSMDASRRRSVIAVEAWETRRENIMALLSGEEPLLARDVAAAMECSVETAGDWLRKIRKEGMIRAEKGKFGRLMWYPVE